MKKNYATGLKSWWRRQLLGTCRLMFSSLIWGSSIEPATPRDWTHMSVVSTLGLGPPPVPPLLILILASPLGRGCLFPSDREKYSDEQ